MVRPKFKKLLYLLTLYSVVTVSAFTLSVTIVRGFTARIRPIAQSPQTPDPGARKFRARAAPILPGPYRPARELPPTHWRHQVRL